MKAIKNFKEFLKEGIVKKQSPDKSRAKFLIKESENSNKSLLELIEKIKLSDVNANMFIRLCYDILMELIRSKMLLDGYNASGQGAHEAEVSYLRLLNFKENQIQFFNSLRYFRNGIIYYGKIMDKEYAQKVIDFTIDNYKHIKKTLDNDIQ
ncbi:hypothetical protein HOK68_00490 [Candidatus Woesearchaeota archaeon]|nr:hypothetical protein [Candidatus Woesearchaeota archaeon]MBT4387139.1 hypothetical protein [Candidatus Woesearchaeota archaeon]MBT4596104.1 hypothetical protein [Candidatus Woesearchaeota archaeon]MBT5741674.1 hypothetical protein [Candidatus Woesearchaeota archaeon]MBT6505239.1 hypothetical protein [Candidatus Woesearchaeota archaeon]